MRLDFHTNHTLLLTTIGGVFLVLSTAIAVLPAYRAQNDNLVMPGVVKPNDAELRGKSVYISEGCQACHTQQVRSNIMDQTWGNRPSIPSDYAQNTRLSIFQNTASLLGSERTGPDLTNVGVRQSSDDWHYIDLYNPRILVPESIMPAYPSLFIEKETVGVGETTISIPEEYKSRTDNFIVPTVQAEDLIAYLKSLKQSDVPDYINTEFIAYDWQSTVKISDEEGATPVLDGEKLYKRTCQACHQANGKGLSGAFPPLEGSTVVSNQDPTEMISIVLFGVDRANEYGAMIPHAELLSDEEIAAVINFERNKWGDANSEIAPEEVTNIRDKGIPEDWPL